MRSFAGQAHLQQAARWHLHISTQLSSQIQGHSKVPTGFWHRLPKPERRGLTGSIQLNWRAVSGLWASRSSKISAPTTIGLAIGIQPTLAAAATPSIAQHL